VCICLDQSSGRVCCAPVSPSHAEAAVSLSYLACVLRVLREHRCEPRFSLDPKDPHDLSGPFLVKRFMPEWLGSTVVGEVLFQADYALKQIAFGDRRLPGIPSAFDEDGKSDRRARASRQWFVVRRAGITVTADGALVPQVEMGVEARRLTSGPDGYTDAPYTDPNDPAVRQAVAVTSRFAEVASHVPAAAELFQVARATVMAVYLLTYGCRCNDSALEKYRVPRVPEAESYPIEIPVLVKDRNSTTVVAKGAPGEDEQIVMHRASLSMRGGVDLAVPNNRKVPARSIAGRCLDARARPVPLPLFLPAASPAAARAA